ncbi:MAG: helix-turn-helix transcriptional regulator [Tenericutes bacterium]|nr:helix-turn-helix transcriptional regulator [Mycoplasmatota bacterium]
MDIAKKIGVAHSTIARMEKNLHSISLGTFVKVLSALDYKLEIVKKVE